jgi:putative ABC transport system permease protein
MLQELRHATRVLFRTRQFAAPAIATLALGIGVTAAIFSVVDAVLFREVPFPDADRLVMVWETDRESSTSHEPGSWPDFVDFERRATRIDTFAGVIAGEATLSDGGEPARVARLVVTRHFLPLLGVTPLAGRIFTADDERLGGAAVVLISERLWERAYNRDPMVLGRAIRIDERPHTIIGVVADGADFGVLQVLAAADYSRGFVDRDPRSVVDIWAPLQPNPQQLVRDTHPLLMIGRLSAGATLNSAQEELASIAADLERTYPVNRARGVYLQPLNDVIFGPTRAPLLVLLVAVGLVLMMSCANVANLLLVRNSVRAREVAVRSALGASTRQLARQFLIENLVLVTVAAAVGMLVAFIALETLLALAPPEVPRLALAAIDARVLGLALAITAIVAFAFGAIPLMQAGRRDLRTALTAENTRTATGGRASAFTRAALVVAEVALAVILVIGAGLLIKSFWMLQRVDPGFDPAGVLKAEFQLPSARYVSEADRWPNIVAVHRFHERLLARVEAVPGIESAAIASSHPLSPGFTNSFVIVGREEQSRELPEMSIRHVTPGYFRTLRLKLIRGRLLDDRDGTTAPAAAVINEAAATRVFGGEDPIGRQIAFWGVRWTIVGIIGDEKIHGLTEASPIAAYVSTSQAPPRGGAVLLVRGPGDAASLASPVRAAFSDIDPALAIFGVEPLSETVSASVGTQRFLMLLLVAFAGLSLGLAAIGIYGVLNYTVAERTREIGIRMALGASSQSVMRLVFRQGAQLTLLGLSVGLFLSALFARALSGLLFGVDATDAGTFAAVVVVLALISAISTWLPVRRAVRIDPGALLRL